MKARVWIEHEVEVEINAEDAITALMELDEPARLPMALRGISAAISFLNHVPDSLITEMNDKQREIVVTALELQTARYKMKKTSEVSDG